jgi:hypothetical protein
MEFDTWKRLQARLQAVEMALARRDNVIRFLVARVLVMLTMVIGFWVGIRQNP